MTLKSTVPVFCLGAFAALRLCVEKRPTLIHHDLPSPAAASLFSAIFAILAVKKISCRRICVYPVPSAVKKIFAPFL
jgi:hypothetical protein